MYTLPLVSRKGGVGKTTLSVGLATFLAHRGKDVLLIDLDSQMNATTWLLGRALKGGEASIYDSLISQQQNRSADLDWPLLELVEESEFGIDYVPANRDLSNADAELANSPFVLQDRLEELENSSKKRYDLCVIDCPPSLGSLVYAALTAADGFVVPLKAGQFSFDGLGQILDVAKEVKRINTDLSLLGLVLNNLDRRFSETKNATEQVRKIQEENVFETEVPLRAKIAEAPRGLDLWRNTKGTDAHDILNQFTNEVLDRADAQIQE